jgi:hypothetical protein
VGYKMKQIFIVIVAVILNSNFSFAETTILDDATAVASLLGAHSRSCDIGNTYEKDFNGRYCAQGYPIIYDGHIVNNVCHTNIDTAYDVMGALSVCQERAPYQVGRCVLSRPNDKDNAGRYCNLSYGVLYRGYIVNNTCYTDIEQAATTMNQLSACFENDYVGRCELSYPNQRDSNNRYCLNSYGVLYRGLIVNNTCYRDIDAAMSAMRSYRFCE